LSEILIGDVVARLRADTSSFDRGMEQAAQKLRTTEQAAQQTSRQLSQLPFNAIQNAIDGFSRSLQQAGNNQERYRTAITQANDALKQFNVTTNASGEMVDRFGQSLSKTSTEALRGFSTGIREAQAELNQLQRFGINAAQAGAGAGGGVLQSILGVAGGIGLATGIGAIAAQLKALVVDSVSLAAKMQDLNLAFRAIDGSAAAANSTLTFLFQTSQKLGVDFERVAEGFKRFDQAAKGTTLEGERIRTVFENILTGARALGSSSQQTASAILALEQMLTKGRLSAEEYRRQLGNAVPGGLRLMAEGLGVTTQALDQMAQSGLIPAEAAVVALAISMGKLGQDPQEAVSRLSTTFAQLKNETVAWMAAIGEGIATKLKPFLDTLVTISQTLRDLLAIPIPGTQPVPERRSIVPSAYSDLIIQQGKAQGVDPGLLSHLIQAESNFNPQARSSAGALGLGQPMLPTAQGLEMGVTAENLLEPERNIRITAKYLSEMLEQFRGFPDALKMALAAYNAGPGNVMKAIKDIRLTEGDVTFERVLARLPRPQETGPYVARVLAPEAGGTAATPGAAGPAGTAATPGTAAPAPGGLDVSQTIIATIDKTMQEIPLLQKQMDALAQSSLNFGGILGEQLTKEADQLVKKFVQTAELLARFPDLLAKMTPEQRAQLDVMTKQVAVFRERMADEAQTAGNAQKRIQEFRAAEAVEAQTLAEDTQAAAQRLQVFREREQQDEQHRQALEAIAQSYGMTKQARDVDTASILANSLAGTVWQKQAEEQLALIKAIAAIEEHLPDLRRQAAASAREFEQSQQQQRFGQGIEDTLERLRLPREERAEERLRAQARKQRVTLTPEDEARLQAITAQERLNAMMAIAGQIGDAAAQSITTGLLSIIDGTQRVGEAFKQMAKSIIDSFAQILLSESIRGLVRLGLGVLFGALGGGAAGAGASLGPAFFTGARAAEGGGASAYSTGFDAGAVPIAQPVRAQGGAVVNKPTTILAGENPSVNPEVVLNRPQLNSLIQSAMRAGPSAGGQAAGGSNVAVILVDNRGQAEREAAAQRGMGRQVIIQEVVRDLSQGSGSTIGRMIRAGGH
jgi:tape measure domain-containing protein